MDMLNETTFIALINNTALLLLLGLLYDLLYPRTFHATSRTRSVLVGIVIGIMGILLMVTPWQFSEGITFDTRSILLSVSGLYFGLIPTVTGALLTAAFRLYQGGVGTLPGISVIIASSSLGLLWRYLGFRGRPVYRSGYLYLLGVTVHAVMLTLMLLLPKSVAYPLLQTIWLPVILIYPVGTALLGLVLTRRREHHRISQELIESRSRLQTTIKSIGDAVITTDEAGNIQLLNPVAEELTGWTLEEAEGVPLKDVLHLVGEQTRKRIEDLFDMMSERTGTFQMDSNTLLIARSGTEHIIALSSAQITDEDSNILGLILVFRDRTQERRNQENIERNAKLESLGVLAGGIAHDFNNLLGGLFGYMELARIASTEQEVKDYLDQAQLVFDRTKDLTRQLLTFAKGGGPIKIHARIEKIVLKNASFALSGSNVSADYEIEPGLPSCYADENQIGQVIENIVLNARQAMPRGGIIVIAVSSAVFTGDQQPPLKEGRYVVCSITDTGIGIEQKHLKKVFDPFYTTKTQGSGLGLAICYSIMQRHDGLIDLSSAPGRGTTFTLYFPAD